MTYDEAVEEGFKVSRQSAFDGIRRHNCLWCDFVADVGDKLEYTGKEVLDWLGY